LQPGTEPLHNGHHLSPALRAGRVELLSTGCRPRPARSLDMTTGGSSPSATAPVAPAAGRNCDKCSLCCKVLGIGELNKPLGTWCSHCRPGKGGCAIYQTRPSECATFNCLWLTSTELDAAWYPPTAKLVVNLESGGNRLSVRVDPAFPTRWREEPYYGRLKEWARRGVDHRAQVVVYNGNRITVVLPNKDVELGQFNEGDYIMVQELRGLSGRDWRAYIKPASGSA